MDQPPTNVVDLFPEQEQPVVLAPIERWRELALTFPSIHRAATGDFWPAPELTPGSLDAFVGTIRVHNGLKWSASFMLELWRPGVAWMNTPRWSPVLALQSWDSEHRAAWRRWTVLPEWF